MAVVPGLKPVDQETGRDAERQKKSTRTQQQDPQSRVRLSPSASPGSYYARPAQPQRNRKAEQFIQALGSASEFSQKVGSYLYEKQKKEAELQAQAEMQSMSLEEAKEKVKSGEIGQYDNPYFQDAFQRQFGIRLGLSKGREMKAGYQDGYNPREGNIDEFISEYLDPEMQAMGDNEIIQQAFVETVQEDVSALREKDYKDKAALIEQDKMDGAFETGIAQFDKRIEQARSPGERQQAIEEGYKEWRNGYGERRELLGLSNAEQDALTVQLAARFARNGDLDVVEKLLTDDRGGVGSILDKRGEAGAKAAEVLNLAERNFHSDNKEKTFDTRLDFFNQAQEGELDEDSLRSFYENNPGAMTEGHYRSLVRANKSAQEARREQLAEERRIREIDQVRTRQQNDLLTEGLEAVMNNQVHRLTSGHILKENGEGYEAVSKEDRYENLHNVIQERVLPRYAEQFDEETRGFETLRYEAEIYSNNPELENTKWKTTLKGVGSALNGPAVANGEVPAKIRDGFTLYQNLKAGGYAGLIDPLISDKDKDVYEAIRLGVQYDGLELDQAVQKAYQISQLDVDDRFITTQYQEMEQAIQDLNVLGDGWNDPKNDGYVTSELSALAQNQARAGGSSDIDSVVERFKEEHEYINGWAVSTRGRNVPPDFKSLAEDKIADYAETHQDELSERGITAEDLTIFPIGGMGSTGAWAIVERESTPMNDRINSQFTISELKEEAEDRRTQRARDAATRSNQSDDPVSSSGHPQAQGWENAFEEDESSGALDINAMRDRLLNPEEEASETSAQSGWEGDLREDEMMATPDRAERTPHLEQDPNADIYTPAQQSGGDAELPEDEDPLVKKAVTEARKLDMNREDFKQYVREFAKNPKSGQTLLFNPEARQRIMYYLPPS